MSDESPAAIPPELQVVVDLQLTVEGLNSAVEHQKIEAALVDVPGVQAVSCSANTVAIRYGPETVTKARLSDAITAAGFSISKAASASPAPTVEPRNDPAENQSGGNPGPS